MACLKVYLPQGQLGLMLVEACVLESVTGLAGGVQGRPNARVLRTCEYEEL